MQVITICVKVPTSCLLKGSSYLMKRARTEDENYKKLSQKTNKQTNEGKSLEKTLKFGKIFRNWKKLEVLPKF